MTPIQVVIPAVIIMHYEMAKGEFRSFSSIFWSFNLSYLNEVTEYFVSKGRTFLMLVIFTPSERIYLRG